MKLNDFIRQITALCKEEQNPEVIDEFGLSVNNIDYVDGNIVLTFEGDLEEYAEVKNDGPVDDTHTEDEEPVKIDSVLITNTMGLIGPGDAVA